MGRPIRHRVRITAVQSSMELNASAEILTQARADIAFSMGRL
jgi:hypothetical protein